MLIYQCYIRWVSSKEIHESELRRWKNEIAEIVCLLEKELPTSFMDLQVHLLIHLVDDVEMASVVSTRWMFFFERYMRTLKRYVRQKAHPEGCMAEGYVLNEAIFVLCEFLGKYYEDGPRIWDEACATDIIDGEKPQSNGVQV